MQGRRLQETGGVFSEIRRGFLGVENDADAGRSFAAVEWHYSDRLLTCIIHEGFYCNRRYEDQNSLRYSFFAPGSYKGRSTSQARWRRTWTRTGSSLGRSTYCVKCASLPSQARLWSLPHPLRQGGPAPCRIPTKGVRPLRNSRAGQRPASLAVSALSHEPS